MTKRVRPWVWIFLNLPFGATSGFVSVTIGWILKNEGHAADDVVAGLVALNLLPHTWKFLWAPVADATLTRKRWYLIGNIPSCATILVIAFIPIVPASIGALKLLIFLNAVCITFVGMAVEGLMAHATPPEEQGRAAGWFQAGNLGGAGIGGGLALLLAQHVNTQVAFIFLAVLLGACTLALSGVPDAPREGGGGDSALERIRTSIVAVAKDVWGVIASRKGIVGLVLCFLPIGSAAASGLFADIAETWHTSATVVAITTGTLGGVVAAIGCIAGGWLSDRMRRAVAYALSGFLLALVAFGMAVAPKSQLFFAIMTLVYSAASGVSYACFTGFVLEVIGKGAAATKYNVFASLSNIPITYMTLVLGAIATTPAWRLFKHAMAPYTGIDPALTAGPGPYHGHVNMLWGDGMSEIAGIVVLGLVILIVRPGRSKVTIPMAKVLEVARETDR